MRSYYLTLIITLLALALTSCSVLNELSTPDSYRLRIKTVERSGDASKLDDPADNISATSDYIHYSDPIVTFSFPIEQEFTPHRVWIHNTSGNKIQVFWDDVKFIDEESDINNVIVDGLVLKYGKVKNPGGKNDITRLADDESTERAFIPVGWYQTSSGSLSNESSFVCKGPDYVGPSPKTGYGRCAVVAARNFQFYKLDVAKRGESSVGKTFDYVIPIEVSGRRAVYEITFEVTEEINNGSPL